MSSSSLRNCIQHLSIRAPQLCVMSVSIRDLPWFILCIINKIFPQVIASLLFFTSPYERVHRKTLLLDKGVSSISYSKAQVMGLIELSSPVTSKVLNVLVLKPGLIASQGTYLGRRLDPSLEHGSRCCSHFLSL